MRALKVDLTFAVGGIKNHEIYFEHLGGARRAIPTGRSARSIERDFGSADAWRADLRATGMAGRGWAWTAFDWDEGRLFNYVGDAQNTFPVWNATPLVALDVYEHAYFLDYQTDRAAYIEAFLRNLDWGVVNGWVAALPHPDRVAAMTEALAVLGGYLLGSLPFGYWVPRLVRGEDIRTKGSGNVGAIERLPRLRALARRPGRAARPREGLRRGVARALGRRRADRRARGRGGDDRPRAARLPRFQKGGKMVATAGGATLALAPLAAFVCIAVWLVVFLVTRYASLASIVTAFALVVLVVVLGYPWPIIVVRDRRRGGGDRAAPRRTSAGSSRGTEHRFELGALSLRASQAASVVWRGLGSPVASSPRSSPTVPKRSATTSCTWIVSKLTCFESRKSSSSSCGSVSSASRSAWRTESSTKRGCRWACSTTKSSSGRFRRS